MITQESSTAFAHLLALSDGRGIFEHALLDEPRREHGYCADDVSRALIVLMREPGLDLELQRLVDTYLTFLEVAVAPSGRVHNRMSTDGRFSDRAGVGDWWGRTLWALGVTARAGATDTTRWRALTTFHRAASVRPDHLRPMAFAALGAAEIAEVHPDDAVARSLLRDAASALRAPADPEWPWPEPRLSYANALLPDALLAAGIGLEDPGLVERGLGMLRFLLAVETRDGHLSVTGTGGRGPAEPGPQFDQQPIEVATIAEACARAFEITGNEVWRDAVGSAWSWFCGDNDSGTVMFDPTTGAGYDGLTADGRNENRGAESTLAVLSTRQHAQRLGLLSEVRG